MIIWKRDVPLAQCLRQANISSTMNGIFVGYAIDILKLIYVARIKLVGIAQISFVIDFKIISCCTLHVCKTAWCSSSCLTPVLSGTASKSTHWWGLTILFWIEVIKGKLSNRYNKLVETLGRFHQRLASFVHHWVRITLSRILKRRLILWAVKLILNFVAKSIIFWVFMILVSIILFEIIDFYCSRSNLRLSFGCILYIHHQIVSLAESISMPWRTTWMNVCA